MYLFMISCYLLMVINLFNLTVSGLMGIFGISFFGANHAQFSLFAILIFVMTETIVMYFFIATGKSIKTILIDHQVPLSEELWNKIKQIKNIIFPQIMITITLVGTLYIFYFGYIASNANKTEIAFSWVPLPLFVLGYFHHLWTLKIKNSSFKMQIEVVDSLPGTEVL